MQLTTLFLQQLAENTTPEWLLFLGRFHPIILHLPIGMLILAFLFELLSRFEKYISLSVAARLGLLLGSITSVITALFGYFLSLEGGYDETLLFWHQWLGIIVAL
ncbi:MAG: ribonuclease inhibitor, partial [Cyclobacteriaceae bacterium]|nr:ribonuclease inhibitor [Cyclobacteriaceae bacterium]